MEEIIKVAGEYYVLATSSLADDRRRVVKHANSFAVFDRYGDIQPIGFAEQGFYHDGTRFLSSLEFQIEGERPLLLSSNVTRDNLLVTVDCTNPDIIRGETIVPRGSIHLLRSKFLWEGVCYEKLRFSNFGGRDLDFSMSLKFEADFADIFEVRGETRQLKGEKLAPRIETQAVVLPYQGVDGILRETRIEFTLAPQSLDTGEAIFHYHLAAHTSQEFEVSVLCASSGQQPRKQSFPSAHAQATQSKTAIFPESCSIVTSNEQFNELISRSVSDMGMLLTNEQGHLYPYAGIPWYSTPFGRDGIITALETLWINPSVSLGVLNYLADRQAEEFVDEQDAEPGKILHEMRFGEMANTGELPYGKYYGSVDSTPLFVVLAGQYLERTGAFKYIHNLWPKIEKALQWIEHHGDLDGDGFLEYQRRSKFGLNNQGWKDSVDSVFHADGKLAQGPIALVEAQAYAYMALAEAAKMAEILGMRQRAMELHVQARNLKKRFERAFWDEKMGCYILALDGEKNPCRIKASNMGHCLFAGIVSYKRAEAITTMLMSSEFNSGWGIRTVAEGESRYNPMSYHNGSIWPHDNALIAAGMARYRFKQEAADVLGMMFHMSEHVDLHRLPELFCGFERRTGDGPTLYPVACSPQAWASAATLYLIQACLGLRIDGAKKRIFLDNPVLPEFLEHLRIRDLSVGDGTMDLLFERHERDVSVRIEKRTGEVGLTLHK